MDPHNAPPCSIAGMRVAECRVLGPSELSRDGDDKASPASGSGSGFFLERESFKARGLIYHL